MALRPLSLILLAVAALVAAGCTTSGSVVPSSEADKASLAEQMLAHPPGSDVKPTGKTKEFDLYLFPMKHEVYPGASMGMWGFSFNSDPSTAQVPGPVIRVTEGDRVIIHFHPATAGYNHTLHFHGQNVPNDQDGVPYQTQKVVESGASYDYEFIAKPAGTYWYHCHVDSQHHIDMGMYGVFIVDPQNPKADPRYDREFVMIMDDMDRYHLEGGQPATGNMPQGGDTYSYEQYARRQANDVIVRNPQVNSLESQTNASTRPNRDWYPVTYAAYTADYQTYVINGHSYPYTETLVAKQGQTIRIRMINAGNTIFAMHLHGHHMLVTHKDGVQLASPYWVDTVSISPGERYDVYVVMDNPGIWDFHDHVGGHTQNDNIFPGGAMTMLCYEGFPGCDAGHGGMHMSPTHSGDLLGWSPFVLP